MTVATDYERIAQLEKRVSELEKRLFTHYVPTPTPTTGCDACKFGASPCGCILGMKPVT